MPARMLRDGNTARTQMELLGLTESSGIFRGLAVGDWHSVMTRLAESVGVGIQRAGRKGGRKG